MKNENLPSFDQCILTCMCADKWCCFMFSRYFCQAFAIQRTAHTSVPSWKGSMHQTIDCWWFWIWLTVWPCNHSCLNMAYDFDCIVTIYRQHIIIKWLEVYAILKQTSSIIKIRFIYRVHYPTSKVSSKHLMKKYKRTIKI